MTIEKKPARPTSYVALDETSRALMDSSTESTFVMDVSGYVLAANEAATRLFGLPADETPQQHNLHDLLPDDPTGARRAKIAEAIRDVRPVRFEEEINGRSLVHSIVPVANPWGEVSRLAVHTLDLTELRKTDEDLRREQQRQIFFMESLPGIVYHLYPDNTIRYANRYFRRYFGSPRGRTCREVLDCGEESCDACPSMEATKTDRALEWDWTDGRGRTFHLQCSPMTDSDGERMIMVLGIDITARQQAEDALKQARDKLEYRVRQRTEELEKTNRELTSKSVRLVSAMKKADAATRAKSAFLANMSHEIRTPLNAVLGMAELAMSVSDPDRKNHYLSRVMAAGNSLLAVINDILDFSKVEAHKMTLEEIDFNVRRTMETALDMHRIPAEKKGLALSCAVDEDVPETLVGDPSRLGQVVANLVSNAVKFTEAGSVGLRVSLAQGDGNGPPGTPLTVVFSVRDTGMGIPEAKQRDIFESFLQADDSITRKHGGTGLGLAICTLLVELMGGEIGLESEEGKGSAFTFTARLRTGDPARVPVENGRTDPSSPPDVPRLKVLLADDNPLNRELASTLLQEQGHDVLDVDNGVKALEALKEERFDLVLMDVQMPIMDGISATRAIRDQNSGVLDPEVPIIALTAYALKGDRERFLEAGMNDYISKPITMRGFLATIARVAGGDRPSRDGLNSGASPAHGAAEFDREAALDMLDGRRPLLKRMDEIFIRDAPEDLKRLIQALAKPDWEEARRMAHSIKGAARTVGALRAGAIAEQMEYLCRQRDAATAEKEIKILESDVDNALVFLAGKSEDGSETA
ncbi:MAG: response regulator [Desulfovibrionaceae bacterium]|nr:response regulator [Desulfovibrionaceae bacterium]